MKIPAGHAEDTEIASLRAENARLREANRAAYRYMRKKVDDLLTVIGTRTLRPEELDDEQLIAFDPIGIVADTFRHILENLRETNRQLGLARDELQAVFDTAGAGLLVLDRERRVVAYNDACRRQFFHGRSIADGCDCRESVCHGRGSGECVFSAVMEGGREVRLDNWRLDGRTYSVIGRPLMEAGGGIGNVVLAYTDVTDRRRAEIDLRRALGEAQQARQKIDSILLSAADGMLVIDAFGRIVTINQRAAELLGLDPESLKPVTPISALGDRRLVKLLQRAPASGKAILVEDLQCLGPSAQERIYQARVTVIRGPRGGLRGCIAFLHEVTQERLLERLKNDFISTAAHEFRTPLASIVGFSELLLDEEGHIPAEQGREYVQIILSQAEHLSDIVTDLLDISRIESGEGLKLNCQAWPVGEICGEALTEFANCHRQHRFELDLADAAQHVLVDRFAFRQILENVIGNAVKYSSPGSCICLASQAEGSFCRLTVSDQGCGMTAEQVGRVFDKFYRADASNTAASGTGLGMTIVKNLVEAQNGEVRVESQPGKGTQVHISLPQAG